MINFKNLVAAAAILATGAASANVLTPVATTEGGEMALVVYSVEGQASYLFDTATMLTAFRASALAGQPPGSRYEYSVNLSEDAKFQSFLSTVGAASDVSFTFFGGDNSAPSSNVAGRNMITTITGDVTAITSGNMVTGMGYIFNHLSVANLNPQINATLGGNANGSALFLKGADGNAYFNELLNDDFQGVFPTTGNLLGNTSDVYNLVRGGSSVSSDAIETKIGTAKVGLNAQNQYIFTFETQSVPTSPVPEAETYALALIGLGVVVAARRRAAK
jgi:PEP-CTERM motif